MTLSGEQLADLRRGLGQRRRYYRAHDVDYPPRDDAAELDLALRWFAEWWRQRADRAEVGALRGRPTADSGQPDLL